MPIRIKPNYDLGLCVINLKSINEIISILCSNFPEAKFSSNYGYREIYDESEDIFLELVSELDTLDSFSAKASGDIKGSLLSIELLFDGKNAKVSFIAQPEHESWIEHFMIDLKKCLLKQTFLQKFFSVWILGGERFFYIEPVSRIILKQKPPNPLIENIKANILSNIIWIVAGMVILSIVQQLITIIV